MLRSDGCDHTVIGMHHITDLLDVAHMAGTHLTDEYLRGGLQGASDGPHHSHRSIKTLRSHQHIIFFLQ